MSVDNEALVMSVDNAILVAVAREYIRSGGRGVDIYEVLEELSYKFGDRFERPDAFTVLEVIEALWADPYIDQVPGTGSVVFARSERDRLDYDLLTEPTLGDRLSASRAWKEAR